MNTDMQLDKRNNDNQVPVPFGELSPEDSGIFSSEPGLSDSEETPQGTGSHCMTLACSAFRNVRQIGGDQPHVNIESSHNRVPVRKSEFPEVSLGCRDLGFDCEFVVTETEARIVLRKFIGHAALSHGLPVLPADLLLKMHQALKE